MGYARFCTSTGRAGIIANLPKNAAAGGHSNSIAPKPTSAMANCATSAAKNVIAKWFIPPKVTRGICTHGLTARNLPTLDDNQAGVFRNLNIKLAEADHRRKL